MASDSVSQPLICKDCWPKKTNHYGPCEHAMQVYNAGLEDGKALARAASDSGSGQAKRAEKFLQEHYSVALSMGDLREPEHVHISGWLNLVTMGAALGSALAPSSGSEQRNWKGIPWKDSIRAADLAQEIALHFSHDCFDSKCGEDADASNCETAWVEDKLTDFLESVASAPAHAAKVGDEVWVRGKLVAPANEHGRIEVVCDSDEQFYVNPGDVLASAPAVGRAGVLEEAADEAYTLVGLGYNREQVADGIRALKGKDGKDL
jgi:hypothetical protein